METLEEQRPPARKLAKVVSLVAAPILGYGSLMAFLDVYGQHDRAQSAQVIVVMGAGVDKQGVPGLSLHARTLRAVELYQQGLAPKIICTGGVGAYPHSEARAAALLAMQHGIAAANVLLEDESTNTWENVRNTALICRAHGWHRIIVVSDPYHLWRVRRNFALMGLEALPSPAANHKPWIRFCATAREALLVVRDAVLRP